MRRSKSVLLVCFFLLLAGCASAPKPLQGSFASQRPAQPAAPGETVRWGGRIVEVEPQAGRTCFQVLSFPLASTGRPREIDASDGRFLACRAGFYDPALFTAGRELTVVGTMDGSEARTVGQYELTLPRLAATAIHLWPERVDVLYYPYPDYFWSPFGRHSWYGPSWRYHGAPYSRPRNAPAAQPKPASNGSTRRPG